MTRVLLLIGRMGFQIRRIIPEQIFLITRWLASFRQKVTGGVTFHHATRAR